MPSRRCSSSELWALHVDTAAGPHGAIVPTSRPDPRAAKFLVGPREGTATPEPFSSDEAFARALQLEKQAEADQVASVLARDAEIAKELSESLSESDSLLSSPRGSFSDFPPLNPYAAPGRVSPRLSSFANPNRFAALAQGSKGPPRKKDMCLTRKDTLRAELRALGESGRLPSWPPVPSV